MGNNMLYAGYGQDDNASTSDSSILVPPAINQNVNEPKFKSWELVGVHNFSKRTLAYAGYVGSKPDGDFNSNRVDDLAVFTVGAKHTF
jgi:predicted porin